MTYEEAKQRLDEWYAGNDVDISPEVLDCCYKAIQKQIPKKVVVDSYDDMDPVYCPCCHEHIGCTDLVYDEFYHRCWSPMYCQECGQAMIWE